MIPMMSNLSVATIALNSAILFLIDLALKTIIWRALPTLLALLVLTRFPKDPEVEDIWKTFREGIVRAGEEVCGMRS